MSEKKKIHALRIKLSENLRDFLLTQFGESINLTINLHRKGLQRDELFLLKRLKDALNIERIIPEKRNDPQNQYRSEYILLTDIRQSVTPYVDKKIREVITEYFLKTLYFELATSRKVFIRDRIFDFIDKYNLRSENARENIEQMIKNKKLYKKKCLLCTDTAIS